MMSNERRSVLSDHFDPGQLLERADFFKHEGGEVSQHLAALERQIMEGLTSSAGKFAGPVPACLLPELGAEIFDTLLSHYLRWYKCRLIAVNQAAEDNSLVFAGYAQIEKPHHLGLGVTYQMQNAPGQSPRSRDGLHKIDVVPGSVEVLLDASKLVRAAVAALQVERTVHHMLEDPADIIRKTLECRLAAAYGYRSRIGEVGLSIAQGLVSVTICAA